MLTPEEQKMLDIVRAFPAALGGAKAGTLHAVKPRYLYHYTDGRGLISILEKHCLWATHSLYLNDTSEMTYALDVLEEAIDDCLKRTTNEAARKLLEPFKGRWVTTQHYDFFVACFCEEGNLLNQWRVYAPSDGFALRFDTEKLLLGQDDVRPRHYFTLMRVVYEETEQRALLDELLGIVVKYAELNYPNPGDVERSDKVLRGQIFGSVLQLLLAFKHPEFKVEREWRLVSGASGPMSYAKYRAGRCGLTPYLEYSVPVPEDAPRVKLPISQVMVGPTSSGKLTGHALHGLLGSCKYEGVEVQCSILPIR